MDDPAKKTLPAVTITAKKIEPKKYRAVAEKVRLYPKGEVTKRSVDSLKRNPSMAKAIGDPVAREGQVPQYGEISSDTIKKLLK